MKAETYRLTLKPDDIVPEFNRLVTEVDSVPLQEVFHHGVHPSSADFCCGAGEKIPELLNDKECIPSALAHISKPFSFYMKGYGNNTPITLFLHDLGKTCYFVEPTVTYADVLATATQWIETHWDREMAYSFIVSHCHGFSAIREFLKTFEPDIRLSSFDDLSYHELQKIVPFEVFKKQDVTILNYGLQCHNFRLKSSLSLFTDEAGRLRLVPELKHCLVCYRASNMDAASYYCEIKSNDVLWYPALTMGIGGYTNREVVKKIAKMFGNGGTFCFKTSIDKLSEILDRKDEFSLSFPDLSYSTKLDPKISDTPLCENKMEVLSICNNIHATMGNESLKELLSRFGKKRVGRKKEMVDRLVETAAEEYLKQESVLDQYFSINKFIRVLHTNSGKSFQLLTEHPLGRLLVYTYVLCHLRGNTILDATYRNDTVSVKDRILAVMERRQNISGEFIRVL